MIKYTLISIGTTSLKGNSAIPINLNVNTNVPRHY